MPTLTKKGLEKILTRGLGLKEPEFRLENAGGRWIGDVISDTFWGKRPHVRQQLIWDALNEALGPDAVKRVGMLLAFTRGEWNLDDLSIATMPRRKIASRRRAVV